MRKRGWWVFNHQLRAECHHYYRCCDSRCNRWGSGRESHTEPEVRITMLKLIHVLLMRENEIWLTIVLSMHCRCERVYRAVWKMSTLSSSRSCLSKLANATKTLERSPPPLQCTRRGEVEEALFASTASTSVKRATVESGTTPLFHAKNWYWMTVCASPVLC